MIGIEGLGVSLGKIKKNLTQSKEEALISSDPDALEKAGFQYHYIAAEGQSANDLALDAIHDLRENLNKEWGTIDVLMHANCFPENSVISLDTNEKSGDVRNRMDYSGSKLQSDLDLKDAFVIGLGQQGCTCTLGGLRVAQALLKSDEHLNNILLVTGDRFPKNSKYEQVYNLISDGAAACLISRNASQLKLSAFHSLSNGSMDSFNNEETMGSFFSYSHRLITELLEKCSLSAQDINWVLPQNTNRHAWIVMAKVLGISQEKVIQDSITDYGHIIGSDNLLNLKLFLESGLAKKGDKILMTGAGHGLNWQAALLEF